MSKTTFVEQGLRPRRAAFLDRDGVIVKPVPMTSPTGPGFRCPNNAGEVELASPGVVAALNKLIVAGFTCIVVTNQGGVGMGYQTKEDVVVQNERLDEMLDGAVVQYYCCAHRPGAGCFCRKPNIGMFLKAQSDFQIDLSQSIMFGDGLSDMVAAKNAGLLSTWLVRSDFWNGEEVKAKETANSWGSDFPFLVDVAIDHWRAEFARSLR